MSYETEVYAVIGDLGVYIPSYKEGEEGIRRCLIRSRCR